MISYRLLTLAALAPPLDTSHLKLETHGMPHSDDWLEADMSNDAEGLPPQQMAPEDGIALMNERLAYLQRKRDALSTQTGLTSEAAFECEIGIARDERIARAGLTWYQTQLSGRN